MEKKILIGGIISIVILIGVSFTSVVGYQSTSRTIAEASPLFNVRTMRVIDEEAKDLSCDYVGKGDAINLLISKIDSKSASIHEIIDRISKMDEEAINRLIGLVSKYQHKNNDEVNDKEMLQFIRGNPNELKNLAKSKLNLFYTAPNLYTVDGHWQLSCYIMLFLDIIGLIVLEILITVLEILKLIPTYEPPGSTLCTIAPPCSL